MPLTYPSYLHLDRLLELQQPRSEPAEHDEMLFIVIHQVYELWFKPAHFFETMDWANYPLERDQGPLPPVSGH